MCMMLLDGDTLVKCWWDGEDLYAAVFERDPSLLPPISLVGVFLAASWPLFICPLSEGESKEVDKLIPASSGTRVASGEETPAVAPAAFFAPNIAIGSADLFHDNQNIIIIKR